MRTLPVHFVSSCCYSPLFLPTLNKFQSKVAQDEGRKGKEAVERAGWKFVYRENEIRLMSPKNQSSVTAYNVHIFLPLRFSLKLGLINLALQVQNVSLTFSKALLFSLLLRRLLLFCLQHLLIFLSPPQDLYLLTVFAESSQCDECLHNILFLNCFSSSQSYFLAS